MLFANDTTVQFRRHSLLNFQDYSRFPVCMAKTSRSLTGDPAVKGAPTGYTLPITNVMVSVGAGFVIPLVGEVKFVLLSQICSLQYRVSTWRIEVMFVIKS